MKKPKVSVIVLNHNGLVDTRSCLESLLKTSYPNFEIYVIDNGSLSNEAEILKDEYKYKRIKVIRSQKNLGFAGGNNKGIKLAQGKYIILLNNDTLVTQKWMAELVELAESDNKIAACQPKIRSLTNKEYFEYAGAAGGFIDKLGYPYARGRIGFHLEKDVGQYNNIQDIFWASGACLLLRKSLLKKAGLLPEEFFFYHEETDLCWRLKDLGFRIVFCPRSIIYHKGAGTTKRDNLKRIFFVHKNNLVLISRNLSVERLLWVMPLRLIMDFISMFFYLMTKKPLFVFSVVVANVSFFTDLPNVIRQRKKIRRNGYFAQDEMRPFSIFWLYFIKNVRRYSEIFGKKSRVPTMYYGNMINIERARKGKQILKKILGN